MKLLVFSDVHTNLAACDALVEAAKGVDVVVGAGDFASVHSGLQRTITSLARITAPAVIVPGNNETLDDLRAAATDWSSAHVLHGDGVEIDGVSFFGLGGGVPITPFGDWSFDFSDDNSRGLLESFTACAVLVSHSQPKNHGYRSSRGVHCGSEAVLETIERVSPRLVVCGHIHDSIGYDEMVGQTRVINAGPKGVVVEV